MVTNKIYPEDPFVLFRNWYSPVVEAGTEKSNAVALSTASPGGRVSSRMVLLRGFDTRGFVFFTNYKSKKGLHLDSNPNAALLFYWPAFWRQVRVEGLVIKTGPGESDNYFSERPRGHQINAWASSQSEEINGLQQLEVATEKLENDFSGTEVPRPSYWGGFRLIPTLFEFWHEGKDRFHERIEYNKRDGKWSVRILAP